jgi:hypothetical protein
MNEIVQKLGGIGIIPVVALEDDVNLAAVPEVERLMKGDASGRVQR